MCSSDLYRPMERLGPGGWTRLRDEDVAESLKAAGVMGSPEGRKFGWVGLLVVS